MAIFRIVDVIIHGRKQNCQHKLSYFSSNRFDFTGRSRKIIFVCLFLLNIQRQTVAFMLISETITRTLLQLCILEINNKPSFSIWREEYHYVRNIVMLF